MNNEQSYVEDFHSLPKPKRAKILSALINAFIQASKNGKNITRLELTELGMALEPQSTWWAHCMATRSAKQGEHPRRRKYY